MGDEERRKRERKARAEGGDSLELDEVKLVRERQRVGLGRHHRLLDRVVVIDGVRTSYHGTLLEVEELGGGTAILRFGEDCVALESLADKAGAVPIGAFEVYSHAILGIGLAKF